MGQGEINSVLQLYFPIRARKAAKALKDSSSFMGLNRLRKKEPRELLFLHRDFGL
jgi:hypothetical protein